VHRCQSMKTWVRVLPNRTKVIVLEFHLNFKFML